MKYFARSQRVASGTDGDPFDMALLFDGSVLSVRFYRAEISAPIDNRSRTTG
jgi:hypothetical protein